MPERVMYILPIVLVVVLFGAAGAASQTAPLRGTVVTEAEHGIKDVRVVLLDPTDAGVVDTLTTDDDGHFEIAMEHVRPGLEIHLSKDGYKDFVLSIGPQHLVMASMQVVLETIHRDTSTKPTATPVPSLVTDELRDRAVVNFNAGVELWNDAESPEQKQHAMRLIREAASLDPDFVQPLIMLSRFAIKNQQWAEASRYSEDWARIDPTSVEAADNIYFCMAIMRHHERIGDAIRRLVAVKPESVDTIAEHADMYFANENYAMARAMYQTLAEIVEEPSEAYLNLGMSCMHLDDVACTKAAFETFLDITPEDHPHRASVIRDLATIEASENPE